MARSKTPPNLLDALFATVRTEAARRAPRPGATAKPDFLRSLLMACQRLLEADPSRRIAVRSPRQTGKSTGVLLLTLIRCLEKAASEWIVICLTRQAAKSIYWGPIKVLNQSFELGLRFNNQELTATLPNGSLIRFVGADNVNEIEKLRGGRYDGVVIDEAKSYDVVLFDELVWAVLEPALMAKAGQLILIGTPGDHLDGPFYLATAEQPIPIYEGEGGGRRLIRYHAWPHGSSCDVPHIWTLHAWSMQDNTTRFTAADGHVYTMWDQALEIKARKGYTDDNPTWRREFLGHWVANDTRRVFRYHSYVHDYTPCADTRWGIPDGEYETILGVDLGTRDGTGVVVWASGKHTKELWEVHSERRQREVGQRFPVGEVGAWIKELEDAYGPFVGSVCDPGGLATMVLDTLADEHQVYLEPAERKEKFDHIELFNNDLDAQRIHLRRGSALSDELREGRWNAAKLLKGKREEDPKIPNDVADAGLYAFRFCNHRKAKAKVADGPRPYTRDWFTQQDNREFEAAREAAKRRLGPVVLDSPFWGD